MLKEGHVFKRSLRFVWNVDVREVEFLTRALWKFKVKILEIYLWRSLHVRSRQLCYQGTASAPAFKDFNNKSSKKIVFRTALLLFQSKKRAQKDEKEVHEKLSGTNLSKKCDRLSSRHTTSFQPILDVYTMLATLYRCLIDVETRSK